MSNIASALKAEILRLSKKAIREHVSPIRSATSSHRHQLATLKKQVQDLQREVTSLRRAQSKAAPASSAAAESGSKVRFMAKGLISLRRRLGLSAEDFGLLIGVSGQSVYHWEAQKTQPRQQQVVAIAQLRGVGKKEVRRRLETLRQNTAAAQ